MSGATEVPVKLRNKQGAMKTCDRHQRNTLNSLNLKKKTLGPCIDTPSKYNTTIPKLELKVIAQTKYPIFDKCIEGETQQVMNA